MGTKLGVILAGGQSSRMNGVNKAYTIFGGETLLERAIKRAAPQVNKLIISANTNIPNNIKINLDIVKDPIEGFQGPLSGLLAAFNWAYKNFPEVEHIASFAVDAPFFPKNLIQRFDERIKKEKSYYNSCYASSGGLIQPVFSISDFSLREDLKIYLDNENRKVDKWMKNKNFLNENFGNHFPDPFFNINTEDDLNLAREIYRVNQNI